MLSLNALNKFQGDKPGLVKLKHKVRKRVNSFKPVMDKFPSEIMPFREMRTNLRSGLTVFLMMFNKSKCTCPSHK